MLFRFCLYGFLKNQRYFDPFLMLALLAGGISFFWIGVLVAIRELTVNLLEIPSGAIADGWSRRRSMIVSFASYVASFLVFAGANSLAWFALAMVLYGIGDSFRTGTHKAMIFEWLRMQGRESERTEVYGYTRSWSQIGSAVSGVLAAVCVLVTANYQAVFLFSAIPCLANMINLWGYPSSLDGDHERQSNVGFMFRSVIRSLGDSVRKPGLRRLMLESMSWEGVLHAVKDYLQPALAALALAWLVQWPLVNDGGIPVPAGDSPAAVRASDDVALPVSAGGTIELSAEVNRLEIRDTAILAGIVYPLLFLMSSFASRRAHRLVRREGSLDRASRKLWGWQTVLFLGILMSDLLGWITVTVLFFVGLHVLLNLWRPILISRFDEASSAGESATILSIESQSQRLSTLVVAPLLGLAIDWTTGESGIGAFWPIGVVGGAAAVVMWISAWRRQA